MARRLTEGQAEMLRMVQNGVSSLDVLEALGSWRHGTSKRIAEQLLKKRLVRIGEDADGVWHLEPR